MKKIGCITFHASHNYGSNLQAYALQQFIVNNFDCTYEIINLRTKKQLNMYNLCFNKKDVKSILKSIAYYRYRKDLIIKYDKYENFINNKLNISKKKFEDINSLKNNKFDYDCCISGSDQIWNLSPSDFDWSYYLEFIDSCTKISYAASFGPVKQNWTDIERNRIKDDLLNYNYISVREKGSFDNVKNLVKLSPSINVDPTLLLSSNEWDIIVNKVKFQDGEYIFFYDLKNDKDTYKLVKKISKILNIPVVVVQESKYSIFSTFIKRFDAGPEDYLNLIKNAKLVLSTSFHGNVFAIIFKKPFFAINSDKDYRINSLLKTIGLDNRTINNSNYVEKLNSAYNINYSNVTTILNEEKKKSTDFLNNAINNK